MLGLTSVLGGGMSGSLGRLRSGMMGASTPSDLMVGILESRTVMDKVVAKCSIVEHYRVKEHSREKARKILSRMTSLATSDEGIVSLAVESKTPRLAADIANCYIEELDDFLRHSNMSRGRNTRLFIECRLSEVESTLAVAQDSLQVFQRRHRVASIDEETQVAIGVYAKLKSQQYLKQAELGMIQAVSSPDNPYVLGLEREVAAFQEQLRKLERVGSKQGFGVGFAVSFESLPAVAAEFLWRYRDFKTQEEAYSMLYQQYEYAKIMEARDTPTLTVLDHAVPPERRSFPRRSVIVLAVFLFSLAMGIGFAFVSEYFQRIQAIRPGEYQGWQEIGSQFAEMARYVGRFFARKKK